MAKRIYDKGERRHKHVGNSWQAEIKMEDGNPKRAVGKCPNNILDAERDRLLQITEPVDNGDSDLPVPKQLYAVYDGAIYEIQTSDFGKTYHAYPYQGKLSGTLISRLEKMADDEKCRQGVDRWIKDKIERHGR